MEAKDIDGQTALHVACMNGHIDVVKALLEKGANVEKKDGLKWTALMFASHDGHTNIVTMLLDHGANVNAEDNGGRTALHYANKNRHTDTVNILEKAINEQNVMEDNKQKITNELVEKTSDRNKIPSLFNLSLWKLPTSKISTINKYELPPKKLGGKRKPKRKTKKKGRKSNRKKGKEQEE